MYQGARCIPCGAPWKMDTRHRWLVQHRAGCPSFRRIDKGVQMASQSDLDHTVTAQLWRDLDDIVSRLLTPSAAPRGYRKGTDEGKALGIATALAYLQNLSVDEVRARAMQRYRLSRKGRV